MTPPKKPTPAQAHHASVDDWCGGHGLPESACTKCHPELIDAFKAKGDWCAEHGFPESMCPTCHPMTPPKKASVEGHHDGHDDHDDHDDHRNRDGEVQHAAHRDQDHPHAGHDDDDDDDAPGSATAPAPDWCVEHALPESACTSCNPALVASFKAKGDWCGEHGFPESACPICNPQTPPPGAEKAAIEARVVRLRTSELEDVAGIQTIPARRSTSTGAITCSARIAFDNDRVADVRALVPGIVRRVRAELGATVARGAPLFDLESTQIGATQGALAAARERARVAEAQLDRQRSLREKDITSSRQVELAAQELATLKAEIATAEATLRMAGASTDIANQAGQTGRATLTAPIAGTVVRRPAVVGNYATEDTSLATVVDTSVMWALCDIAEGDAARVALGQALTVTIDADENALVGEITWIATEVDPRSRTVTARADVPNPEGRLRANQFARARLQTGAPKHAVEVPRASIQRVTAGMEVVFVRLEAGVFAPRVIERVVERGAQAGGSDGPMVQVLGRVAVGDAVATTGAVLLRTEVMPGSIGAGCCEPPNEGSR